MRKKIMLVLCIFLLVGSVTAAEIITQDKEGNLKLDFSPEEIVYIYGTDFNSNSLIEIDITRPDGVVESFIIISGSSGEFLFEYVLNGIVGNYYVYATDGSKSAQVIFTDAAIWTTNNDCGDQTQDANHFDIGAQIHINGDGFNSGNFSWEIKGKPGGASCDPNTVVASGIQEVNNSGEFCFNAYNVSNDDCGEYQVKYGVKGDNYRVIGNTCGVNSDCGLPESELICGGNDIFNFTTTPICRGDTCTTTNNTVFFESCGESSSRIICFEDDLVNVTITPGCASGNCVNSTNKEVIEVCEFGCRNDECIEPVCGNGQLERSEQCDDGNLINGDGCNNRCRLEFCGDGIVQVGLGEQCDEIPELRENCSEDCKFIYPQEGLDCALLDAELSLELSDPLANSNDTYSGHTIIKRSNLIIDVNNITTIDVEIIQLSLKSVSPRLGSIEIRKGSQGNSAGQIKQINQSQMFPMSSFFDVFFEIRLLNLSTNLNNTNPLRLIGNVHELPLNSGYNLSNENSVSLELPNGSSVGIIKNYTQVFNSIVKCPICGDDELDIGEECDDGNDISGDGCDPQCRIECPDQDDDDICDKDDFCPDSLPEEPVDENGCDIFQFCDQQACGINCFELDWRNNEPNTQYPNDCTVVVFLEINKHPLCVPTKFDESCAG